MITGDITLLSQVLARSVEAVIWAMLALFILRDYWHERSNKFFLSFGMAFVLMAGIAILRNAYILTGNIWWFFAHRILTAITLAIFLQSVSYWKGGFIVRYKLAPITLAIMLGVAYVTAFVFGGLQGETSNPLSGLLFFGSLGAILLIPSYYFFKYSAELPDFGGDLLAAGFVLLALLSFAAPILLKYELRVLLVYAYLAYTVITASGWYLSFHRRK